MVFGVFRIWDDMGQEEKTDWCFRVTPGFGVVFWFGLVWQAAWFVGGLCLLFVSVYVLYVYIYIVPLSVKAVTQ